MIDWGWVADGLNFFIGGVFIFSVISLFGALWSWVGRKTGIKIGDD